MKIKKTSLRGKAATLRVKRSRNRQWYFVLVAANGEPIVTSETYTRPTDAVRACTRFRQLAGNAMILTTEI